jgi:hypothetical protein
MRAPCRIDGCEKESRGRGLCATHWARWRKHGDPLVVKKSGVDFNVAAQCSVDNCGKKSHAHGYCTTHLRRWQKYGDALFEAPITGRPTDGEHPSWSAVHKRLARMRGVAKVRTCIDCHGPADEWSYDGTDPDELVQEAGRSKGLRYSLDLDHYVPRCVPCHRTFDAGATIMVRPLEPARAVA